MTTMTTPAAPTPNRSGAAFEFASIAAQTSMLGGRYPGPGAVLRGFDFDHYTANALDTALDSALVDGDPAHPYVADSVGKETSQFVRAAASLAFALHANDPDVRPNRLRAEAVCRTAEKSNLAPVLLEPLRMEFCLDVMLFCHWFTHANYGDAPAAPFAIGEFRISPAIVRAGASHYLGSLAFAHAMQYAYPVLGAVYALPVVPTIVYVNRAMLDVDEIAALRGNWSVSAGDNAAIATAPAEALHKALAIADSVGVSKQTELLTTVNTAGGATLPMGAVLADVGGTAAMVFTSGHTLRQFTAASTIRGGAHRIVEVAETKDVAAPIVSHSIDASMIPDVFYCHAPVGGPGFFHGLLSTGQIENALVVAEARRPLPFAVVDYARRAAVAARLPWLERHLPTVAQAARCCGSLSDQRVNTAGADPMRNMLRVVRLAAEALGIDAGHRGLEASLTGVDY